MDFGDGIEPTQLYATKKEVSFENNNRLKLLTGQSYEFNAVDSGDPAFVATFEKSMPAVTKLVLKVGTQVMCLKNLDPKQGLVNGSRGVVLRMIDPGSPSKIKTMTSMDEVKIDKNELERVSPECTWPVVRYACGLEIVMEPTPFTIEVNGKVEATRLQIPLILAWSLTIHKCQGMSLDRGIMSLGTTFEDGQGMTRSFFLISIDCEFVYLFVCLFVCL